MQCFLEAGVKRLRRHGKGFLFSTTHVMKETIASGNGVSSRSNMIKEGVADFYKSVRLEHSVVIFCVVGFI